jgi:uncharacterized protein (TIGR02118 family)
VLPGNLDSDGAARPGRKALLCPPPAYSRRAVNWVGVFFFPDRVDLAEKTGAMIKFVFCVRRRPELTAEAFRRYWLEKHGPLVRQFAQALKARRYVQSHTLDTPFNQLAQAPRGSAEPYDGITEIWWDGPQDILAAINTAEGQAANRALAEDEARFCDLPRCSVFFTEEHTIFGS